jgi:hypothetical protein
MVGLTVAVVGGLVVRRSVFEITNYGVAPDGRLLMLREVEAVARSVQLQVVLGFADEVHRLVSERQ